MVAMVATAGKGLTMGVLSQRVHDKLSSAKWHRIRNLLLQVSEILLGVSTDAQGELAGQYVKFATDSHPSRPAYAVVWPNMSLPRRLLVGLALPDNFDGEHLGPVPEGVYYPGLTRFLVINEGQAIPGEFSEWAKRAYDQALLAEK
jgi:hypothetical protein